MNLPLSIRSFPFICAFILSSTVVLASGGPRSNDVLVYESLAGDYSDIKLSILENHTFVLEMFLMEDNELITMAGTWGEQDGIYQLTFTKNKPIIRTLFSKDMVLNDTTFTLDSQHKSLWIWSTLCSQVTPQVASN